MASIHVNIDETEWTSGVPFYGSGCLHEGKDLVQLRILCDRRDAGGGITWIARFLPPPGKLIKVVAIALSDEHIFAIAGGRTNKSGQPATWRRRLRAQHERSTAQRDDLQQETTSLIVYTGEPDEVRSIEV